MIKGIFKNHKELIKSKELVAIELSEAKEIADLIVSRIEKKIEILKAIETNVDEKIVILQQLIDRLEIIKNDIPPINRETEVLNLYRRGLKIDEIAEILDMPLGEVELILNLQSNLT